MPHFGEGTWHVTRCSWTLSRKWKHGTSRCGMPSVFVLNSVTVLTQHMENYSRPLEMLQYQETRWFVIKSTRLSLAQNVFWRRNPCRRWSAPRTTINNTYRWQHNTGERTCSIWSKINNQNDCWWSEHEPGNRSFDSDWRIGDKKN